MKPQNILNLIFISFLAIYISVADAEESNEVVNPCDVEGYSGDSVKLTESGEGSIGDFSYEFWFNEGSNPHATLHEDGSFTYYVKNAQDSFCRLGLSFDNTKPHERIGHLYADFKIDNMASSYVVYSYIGIHGWSRNPLIEYYIVEKWNEDNKGDWVDGQVINENIMIDDDNYTVYKKVVKSGRSIDGDSTTFTQIFSVRDTSRGCGTVDITAHFKKWEELGIKLGNLHDAKVIAKVRNKNDSRSIAKMGLAYAKVYVKPNKRKCIIWNQKN